MEVKKIMTKNPASCTPDSTLQEVAHMMEMYDCGCIPVVESHKSNMPIGTITDRDIAVRAFAATGGNPLEMKASDIMTTDLVTITPETSVEQCRDVMENRQIRRILVVDKSGRCVGIVAQADVVQADANSRETAEFIRDISQPASASRNENFSSAENFSNRAENNDVSSDRRSYQNFSNQDFSQIRDFAGEEQRYNQTTRRPGKKFKKSVQKERSFFSLGNLTPLLIAVGAGAAIKYFMPVDEKSQTTFVPRAEVTSSLHTAQETTPKVSIELPTTETNTNLKDSQDTGSAGIENSTTTSTPMTTARLDKNVDTDLDTNPEIGRSARL